MGRSPDYFTFALGQEGHIGGAPYGTMQRDHAAAFEIAPYSEVDRVVIQHQGGRAYCAVGAPAIGPFKGPFFLLSEGGAAPPFTPETVDNLWTSGAGLREAPPIVGVALHYDCPHVVSSKRGACSRRFALSAALTASYAIVAEIPVYGRRVTTAILQALSTAGGVPLAGTMYFQIHGVIYRPVGGSAFGSPAGEVTYAIGDYEPMYVPLIVNPTNDATIGPSITELLVTCGGVEAGTAERLAVTIEAEGFHVLRALAKLGTAASGKIQVTSETQD